MVHKTIHVVWHDLRLFLRLCAMELGFHSLKFLHLCLQGNLLLNDVPLLLEYLLLLMKLREHFVLLKLRGVRRSLRSLHVGHHGRVLRIIPIFLIVSRCFCADTTVDIFCIGRKWRSLALAHSLPSIIIRRILALCRPMSCLAASSTLAALHQSSLADLLWSRSALGGSFEPGFSFHCCLFQGCDHSRA